MSNNFFIPQLGFKNDYLSQSNDVGKKSYVATSFKKDEFKTTNSKPNTAQNNKTTSEKNKKFSELINELNKKEDLKNSSNIKKQDSKNYTGSLRNQQTTSVSSRNDANKQNITANNGQAVNTTDISNEKKIAKQQNIEPLKAANTDEDLRNNPSTNLDIIISDNKKINELIKLQSQEIGNILVNQSDSLKNNILVNLNDILVNNHDNNSYKNTPSDNKAIATTIDGFLGFTTLFESHNDSKLNGNDYKTAKNREIKLNSYNIIGNNIIENDAFNSLAASVEKKIKHLFENIDSGAITLNINASQLSQLKSDIKKYIESYSDLSNDEIDDIENLISQFVALTPPLQTINNAGENSQKPNSSKNNVKPLSAFDSATLKQENDTFIKSPHDGKYENIYDTRYTSDSEEYYGDLEGYEDKSIKTKENSRLSSIATQNLIAKTANKQGAGQIFLQMSQSNPSSPQFSDILLDSSAPQFGNSQNTGNTIQNSITNIITQSQNAGANHPATQMVSATIQKAIKSGDATNIKLRLDPPELGRVEVKMSIDKDNVTKIILTAEKPETYMLLKQDTDILQRAMSNAGLDADGNLSFELAKDDNFFNDDNNNKNGHSKSNSSLNNDNNENLESDLIETTINWQLDPNTGRMRYSALV